MRPEVRRQRLVVRHQRGERDEDEGEEERERRRDEDAVVRNRDEQPLAADPRGRSAADERGDGFDRGHLAPECTQRRELRTIASVTANETAKRNIAIADA